MSDNKCILFEESKKDTTDKSIDIWSNSKFSFLKPLSTDEKGRWGENYFKRLVENYTSHTIIWDEDKNTNQPDGSYDMKINDLRVEVKTAMKSTKNESWQHDQIKKDEFDKIVFFDLNPNDTINIIILHNSDIPYTKDHINFNFMNRKATACKGSWKYDINKKALRTYTELGQTFCYDLNNTINNKNINEFLTRQFLNVKDKTTTEHRQTSI